MCDDSVGSAVDTRYQESRLTFTADRVFPTLFPFRKTKMEKKLKNPISEPSEHRPPLSAADHCG